LLESSDDELERALLLSARADMPSRGGLQDTALALGLAAPAAKALADALLGASAASGVHATASAATASSATASASALASSTTSALGASTVAGATASASVATIAKFLVGGALVSFVSMAALDRIVTPSAPPAAPQARAQGGNVAPAPVFEASPVAPRAETPLVATAEAPVPAPESDHRKAALKRSAGASAPEPAQPVTGAAPSSAVFAAPSAAATPSNASLAAEIRLLDRTRAALGAGDTQGAQRLLHSYDQSRPSGVLSQEANLLRVRLLLARGDRRSAASLARQIIAEHPESTHVDSLRSLAAE